MRATIAALALAVAGALATTGAQAADFELTYASPYSATHPYGAADEAWIARIEEQTGGRVKITPYWGKVLITSREGIDELRAGVADIAYISPIYATSGYELTRQTPAFFYGYSDPQEVLEVYLGLWDKYPQFAEELEGVKVLGYNVGTPMHLQLRERPVNTIEDLKGLRIRSANDYIGPLAAFGAEGVAMPMTDTYPALQRGVLDGVIAPYEALKSLSFGEVVKYYSELPHSRGAYPSRGMNMEVWNSLPADIQAVFEENIGWLTQKTFENANVAEEEGRLYGIEQGVTFNAVSEEVVNEYAKAFVPNAQKIAAELDAAGLPGTEVLQAVRAAHEGQ